MNKICTDIKQSKKLIELGIDIGTADMHYMYRHWEIDEETIGSQSDASIGFDSDFYYETSVQSYHYIPAWSLTALLGILTEQDFIIKTIGNEFNIDIPIRHCKIWFSSLLDTTFEMVCWLICSRHNKYCTT